MIAFQVSDMTSHRSAGVVTKAVKEADHGAQVRVDMATFTIEIEESRATAHELSDAIKHAGYLPIAAA
jgi:copper chaperone